jgi:hypothetical protein
LAGVAGASVRVMAPFPVTARRTGHVDLPRAFPAGAPGFSALVDRTLYISLVGRSFALSINFLPFRVWRAATFYRKRLLYKVELGLNSSSNRNKLSRAVRSSCLTA